MANEHEIHILSLGEIRAQPQNFDSPEVKAFIASLAAYPDSDVIALYPGGFIKVITKEQADAMRALLGAHPMDIQEELDNLVFVSCAHCKKDIMEEPHPQYCGHCEQNICHACWHKQYPGVYCLVCESLEEGDTRG